jgi:glucose-1-phosphate thymidylyltransferase
MSIHMENLPYKGIVLAGGTGSRLSPITRAVSKQLLPIYDKPMIYYSLSVLMLAHIKDILIITTPHDAPSFQRLLGDGSQFGINLTYAQQAEANGIAQSFIIGEKFIDQHPVCLVLGDNIFFGQAFSPILQRAKQRREGATIFGYQVSNPSSFGVATLGDHAQVIHLEEKPQMPKSNWAVTGLYFYDHQVVEIAKSIKPSARGELEITTVNQIYLERQSLYLERLGRGFAWLDTGTHDSLLEASSFVQTIEKRQGFKIGCLEEIAYRNGWLSKEDILKASLLFKNTDYGTYLKMLATEILSFN